MDRIFNRGDKVKSSDEWTRKPFIGTVCGFSRDKKEVRIKRNSAIDAININPIFLDRC